MLACRCLFRCPVSPDQGRKVEVWQESWAPGQNVALVHVALPPQCCAPRRSIEAGVAEREEGSFW
jgi:hypothetical protein